jgi:hypothetical protein
MAFGRGLDRGARVVGVRMLARQPTRNGCLRETRRSDDSSIGWRGRLRVWRISCKTPPPPRGIAPSVRRRKPTMPFEAPVARQLHSLVKPPLLGLGTKETRDAQIFVQVRPVNSGPVAKQLVVFELLGRCAKQTREPCQRNGDPSAVGKHDGQFVAGEGNLLRARVSLRKGRTHAKLPQTDWNLESRWLRSVGVHDRRIRWLMLARPAGARTWPEPCRAERERGAAPTPRC